VSSASALMPLIRSGCSINLEICSSSFIVVSPFLVFRLTGRF
jgi:hypothetical protein